MNTRDINERFNRTFSFNSPVILGFVGASFLALLLGIITQGYTNKLLFSVYKSSLANPFTYLRFVGHVLGHADWGHFINNMMLILIVGPLLEEKYGSSNMVLIILTTAIVTGLVNFIFFPYVQLLGASGVVFAFILLSSFTGIKEGKFPITFVLVAILYLGGQIYEGIISRDNISQMAHIVGGIVGATFGYFMNVRR